MSKIYNIPLECNFFRELARIVLSESDVTRVFLPNNRSCRAFKREMSKYNCVAPEIISISDILNFPDTNFLLLKFLRNNTYSIPFSTLFDLSQSLSTLIRNLIFNRADYRKLMVPEKLNESWKSTLLILEQVLENPEISELKNNLEAKLDAFFSSIEDEKIAVAGLLEENFYNRRLYSQALDSGFVVVSGLENKFGDNFKKINRLFQERWDRLEIENKATSPTISADRKILELDDNSDEALAVALVSRKMLAQNKSVLIVSPNLSLTQKIKMELLKWNIVADDSSGVALHRTLVGQVISQIISVIERGFQNADIINLLKFNDSIKNSVFKLEDFLRKKENYPQDFFQTFELFSPEKEAGVSKTEFKASGGMENFFEDRNHGEDVQSPFLVESDKENFSEVARNGDEIPKNTAELAKLFDRFSISDELNTTRADNSRNENPSPFEILVEFVDRLKDFSKFPKNADFNFWREYFSEFINLVNVSAADEFSEILQPQNFENISLSEFCIFLKNHFLENSLRQNISYTPGVVILGILESQLADADLVIVCGANENSWRSSGSNDFWMSDSMLRQLKIDTVDEHNEFYACVWEKLLSKPNILVTRSLMENGEQTQCYSRLKNYELKKYVSCEKLIRKIKSPSKFSPIRFCAPSPTTNFRPTTFWVSDLDLLISNPYVYYAKKILRLKELPPLNSRKNLKGNLIHKIFDDFAKKHIRDDKFRALQQLFRDTCREKFVNFEHLGLWYFNVDSILKFFVQHFNCDAENFSEISGHINLKISHEDKNIQATIASKADRLEIDSFGNISIIDYKTGEIPSLKKVKDGEKIQLPIEAIIASKDGFRLGKTNVEKMSFWQVKSKEKKIAYVSKTSEETAQICKDILAKIEELLRDYTILEKPYDINRDDKYNKPYIQLARVKEISG
ncbi:MAG: PD-(D/E)XK nuclease family protein [Alphaproteobacteria bacterium]|nr:PD-(D/E)XK nuclease family protein [Alphaproteobacteria bacterium]